MKKMIALLAAFVMVISLAGSFAAADAIVIPPNDFLEEHQDECEYIEVRYRADEDLTLYKSPEDGTVVTTVAAGTTVTAQWRYTDENGQKWAHVWLWEDETTGWFPTYNAVRLYNGVDFLADYKDSFTAYANEAYDFSSGTALYYTYPNSGEYYEGPVSNDISFTEIYTDEWGNNWGYVGYYMLNEGWLCLNDPENAELPVKTIEAEQDIRPENAALPDAQPNTLLFVCCIVGAVVLASAVLMLIFFRKKSNQQRASK
ncbi:MAG: hypothetical protein Q4C01_00710 [Clostridia bacterium]|nr:hypothetical protein [Clostridia bacterium]